MPFFFFVSSAKVEQAIEARMLFAWANYILEKPTSHLSKHYDGIRVSLDRCKDEEPINLPGPLDATLTGVDALCMHSTQFIKDQTGFEMRIRHKVHKTCMELISAYADKKGSPNIQDMWHGDLSEDCIILFLFVFMIALWPLLQCVFYVYVVVYNVY